jgi:hypothetical protein
VDVSAQIYQISFIINESTLGASFEQCTASGLLPIERLGVAVEQPLDKPSDRVVSFRPEEKVVMIWHKAVGNHRYCCTSQEFLSLPQ